MRRGVVLLFVVLMSWCRFSCSNDSCRELWESEKQFVENLKEYISCLRKDVQGLRE